MLNKLQHQMLQDMKKVMKNKNYSMTFRELLEELNAKTSQNLSSLSQVQRVVKVLREDGLCEEDHLRLTKKGWALK